MSLESLEQQEPLEFLEEQESLGFWESSQLLLAEESSQWAPDIELKLQIWQICQKEKPWELDPKA